MKRIELNKLSTGGIRLQSPRSEVSQIYSSVKKHMLSVPETLEEYNKQKESIISILHSGERLYSGLGEFTIERPKCTERVIALELALYLTLKGTSAPLEDIKVSWGDPVTITLPETWNFNFIDIGRFKESIKKYY